MGDEGRRDSVTVKLTGCEDDGGGDGGVTDEGGGVADMVIARLKEARKRKIDDDRSADQPSSGKWRRGRNNGIS